MSDTFKAEAPNPEAADKLYDCTELQGKAVIWPKREFYWIISNFFAVIPRTRHSLSTLHFPMVHPIMSLTPGYTLTCLLLQLGNPILCKGVMGEADMWQQVAVNSVDAPANQTRMTQNIPAATSLYSDFVWSQNHVAITGGVYFKALHWDICAVVLVAVM